MQTEPLTSITRSYKRSISHQYYGGKQYESSEFFSSRTEYIYTQITEEEMTKLSNFLYQKCCEDVEEQINKLILELNPKFVPQKPPSRQHSGDHLASDWGDPEGLGGNLAKV